MINKKALSLLVIILLFQGCTSTKVKRSTVRDYDGDFNNIRFSIHTERDFQHFVGSVVNELRIALAARGIASDYEFKEQTPNDGRTSKRMKEQDSLSIKPELLFVITQAGQSNYSGYTPSFYTPNGWTGGNYIHKVSLELDILIKEIKKPTTIWIGGLEAKSNAGAFGDLKDGMGHKQTARKIIKRLEEDGLIPLLKK
ncbi:hypothetical protein EV198_2974 [Roseivirga ehrenbergii]|uniref:DUF4136 domain-containing protein n=1 Tax=Roseivirga ehrenbergii (strain DSM 102268 / JCM 13514 / KCTC 12282 / NCIMB 14502 / KMM 6017) TaxID=279360 RepID=A0A150XQW5_ROSEK|nr:hypothetical protein [Roseivirga ehrenbergii]KYG81084.1 hypothetical protein MB14_15015 [Roseivirga ehrenbergii]TCL00957.1 hypothetical protein EV198_2974 [Roseivirga ehrenbergii]